MIEEMISAPSEKAAKAYSWLLCPHCPPAGVQVGKFSAENYGHLPNQLLVACPCCNKSTALGVVRQYTKNIIEISDIAINGLPKK